MGKQKDLSREGKRPVRLVTQVCTPMSMSAMDALLSSAVLSKRMAQKQYGARALVQWDALGRSASVTVGLAPSDHPNMHMCSSSRGSSAATLSQQLEAPNQLLLGVQAC